MTLRTTAWLALLSACGGPTDDTVPDPTDADADADADSDTDTDTDADTDVSHSGVEEPLPTVVINEVMPGNQSTINGPDPDALSLPDWVELVNTGDEPVAFSRLQLRNDSGGLWTGAADDGSLAPGERRVVWCDVRPEGATGVWTGFPLDKENDEVSLIGDDRLLETVKVEAVGSDVSLARTPDLTGELVATAWPTPGQANPEAASPTLNVADETLFVTDRVHRIDFSLTPQAIYDLDLWDRPEVHGGLAFDGVRYADVGIKLKGSASYAPMSAKPAFILDLNEWVPGTKLRGLQAIRLHNGNVLDPTRVRDHLTYKFARAAGLMAPRVGWAQLFVNGEDYGIYMLIERHDDQFVKYHHPEQELTGVVMEPNETESGYWGGDFGMGMALDWNYEEGPIPADPASMDAIANADRIAALQPTDEHVAELFTYVDQDLLFTYLSWETIANHTDGYKSPNNWRVYVDGDTHLVSLLPSGAEWTWDGGTDPYWFGGRLGRFCIQNRKCKKAYSERLLEVADLAESLGMPDEFVAQSQFLDPWIQADPRYSAWYTPEQQRASTWQYLTDNPGTARQQVYTAFPELQP